MCILISCESGGKNVPAQLLSTPAPSTDHASVFQSALIQSDAAAKYITHRMSQRLNVPLIQYEYGLQAIDVTRSLHHPKLFSRHTRSLSVADRQCLIDDFYVPYRDAISSMLAGMLKQYGYVVHLSVRTFELLGPRQTPRRTDVGLLYDPASGDESDLCADWLEELYFEAPMLKVRRNYPRRGSVDSLIKAMRNKLNDKSYLGVELLLNRAWAGRSIQVRDTAIDLLCDTLMTTLRFQQSQVA